METVTSVFPINYPNPSATDLFSKTLEMSRGMYLFESFWRDKSLEITVPLESRNQYNYHGLKELREATVKLHNTVSPVHGPNLTSRYLVFGIGATQCFHAALYAYHVISGTELSITTELPGYLEYKSLVDVLHRDIKWVNMEDITDLNTTIEVVCSPNNPDGKVYSRRTRAKYAIHDNVNTWPFFYSNPQDYYNEDYSDQDISIYSYPKILGFSASRVGYAFVRDERVAKLMEKYIAYNCHGLCTEGQLKCLTGINYILKDPVEYMNMVTLRCKERWEQFIEAVAVYNSKSDIKLTVYNSSGPTAWILCSIPALQWVESMNIVCTYGPEYGGSDNHVRVNILAMPNEFNEMIRRLKL